MAQRVNRAARERDRKPNVLLIMTDQHRWDMMGCAGRDEVPTPNLDALAAEGVRFSNAYCSYPSCVASRNSLMTGLHAHTTGAITNRDTLDWRYRTMAHHFNENGYLSALIGKMHFNDAMNHGFSYYLSINDWMMYLGPKVQHFANEIANHPTSPNFFETMIDDGAGLPDVADLWDGPSPWVGNVERFDFRKMASELEEEDHLDSFIARESVKFMQKYQGRDEPFFLVTSFMKPHTPFYAPKTYAEQYPVDDQVLPDPGDLSQYPQWIQQHAAHTLEKEERLRKAHQAGYRGNLAFVDTCIGTVLDSLDEMGIRDNTVVVYTSDHSDLDGDHGLYQKFCLYEGAIRTPLMVSWPERIPRAKVADALVQYIGLFPTLVDLTDTHPYRGPALVPFDGAPEDFDEPSFAHLCEEPDGDGPDYVFSEWNMRDNPQYMIRSKKYKFIYTVREDFNELYDLETDSGEHRNLALGQEHADIVAAHMAELTKRMVESGSAILKQSMQLRP